MKVDFTSLSRIRLSALSEDDGLIARDIVRRLRSASTPIGNRIPGNPPTCFATRDAAGGAIVFEVAGSVAEVTQVLSAAQRDRQANSGRSHLGMV
jgi:hypothetical protein